MALRDYDIIVRSTIDSPVLSVIVAIHDMERNGYLSECLASFDAQGCTPGQVEYVLADDCSNDDSLTVARRWAERRTDTTVIHLHENMRQGAARNRAIDVSHGRWFSTVDADDFVSPDYVSSIVTTANRTGADAVIAHWMQLVDAYGEPISQPYRNLQSPQAVGELDESKRRQIILKHWQFGAYPHRLFDDRENRYLEGMFYEDTPVDTRWILQLNSVAEAGGGYVFLSSKPRFDDSYYPCGRKKDRRSSQILCCDSRARKISWRGCL